MTAEDKCRVCKDILDSREAVTYMQEGIYAVRVGDMAVLTRARSPKEAFVKARSVMTVNQYGSNNTCIHNVGTLNL